jgi:glycosyltransferase involved in cell wall biosynthesis
MTKYKVAFYNTYDLGGAYNAAYRAFRAVTDLGVDASFYTEKDVPFKRILSLVNKIKNRISKELGFEPSKNKVFLSDGTTYDLANGTGHYSHEGRFSKVENLSGIKSADIIHFHWLGPSVNYARFFASLAKPVVFTLHDEHLYSGVFHYQNDLKLNAAFKNTNAEIIEDRIKTFSQFTDTIVICSPSKWILERAKHTFGHINHIRFELVYNSIPIDTFFLKNSASGNNIGFVAHNTNDPRKGFDLLKEAIKEVDYPVMAIGIPNKKDKSSKIKYTGQLKSKEEMVKAYHQMKFLVLSSREDNLPNTMLEAFACGIPVVAFKIGGMAEHIVDGFNGFLAPDLTAESLKVAIEKAIQTDFDAQKIRAYAEKHFSPKVQGAKYKAIYDSLIKE